MKKIARRLSIALLAMLMLTVFCVTAFAGTRVYVLDNQVSIEDSASNITASGDVVEATASGSFFKATTQTLTVTNFSGSKASIGFDWSITNRSGFTINDTSIAEDTGHYSIMLDADACFTIVFKGTSGLSSKSSVLTLSNFSLTAAAASSSVTINYDSALGSVTAAGYPVSNGGKVTDVNPDAGTALVATPNSGVTFLGWVDTATNQRISADASYPLKPASDMTVEAVFVDSSSNAYFLAGGSYLTTDLNAAGTYASTASNKTVVLMNSGTLAAGSYTIPSGVTLLIPFDSANTLNTTTPTCVNATYVTPTAYRTMTMASGANLSVNGSLCVGGSQNAAFGSNGMVHGPVGFIKMSSGSTITLNSGANLYAWGYITGSGSVTAKSGATVYEDFQLADFRGGDGTSQMADNDKGVFPMSQYYLQNIEVPLTLEAGSMEYAYMSAYITLAGLNGTNVPIVGDSGAMFTISSGCIVKDYLEGTGRTEFKIDGEIAMTSISMSMKLAMLGSTTINSKNFNLPIPSHMTVTALGDSKVSINQDIALLPGSELYITEGVSAVLADGVRIIVYDSADWGGYCGASNKNYVQLKYAPGGLGTTGREKDALVEINGTIDASAGAVYTTSGGANIYSTGAGKVITTAGTETVTYQATQTAVDGNQEVAYVEIAVKPAVLKNADGSNVETAGASSTTYNYNAEHGKWVAGEHTFAEGVVTAPTCTTAGYTTHTCACGYSYTDAEKAATGHTEVIDAAVAATCTTTGKTEGKHCSVCGTVTVAQTEVAALGHTEVTDAAVAATCTTAGKTEGKHCSECNEVLVAQEVVAALGHTEVTDAAVAATCTTAGKTEGKHCSVCGTVTVAQEVVAALGHTEVTDAAVPATLGTAGKTEGKHCSECGKTLVEQVETAPLMSTEWSMTLSDDLSVNFYIDVDDSVAANTNITVSFNGAVTEYKATELPESISVKVAAVQMNDEITVTAVNGEDIVTKTYTVKQYADAISKDSKYYDIAQAMLNYGGAAQTYFGYNTGNLVSSEIVSVELPEADAMSVSGSAEGIKYYGATLVYREKIAVRFYFTGSIDGITFMVGEKKYEAVTKDGMCYVEIADILPQNLDQQITLTATDASGNTLTVTYGPMNYIVRMNAKGSESLQNLMKALYSYHVAAKNL